MRKVLMVGAGFAGSVIARQLADEGHHCTVIDKRDHIAGNAYDYVNEIGIRVHKYGPHLFHTSDRKAFDYLSRFTKWTPYQHKVKALLKDGRYATLPVNKETKDMVGEENVLDTFFRPYTKKMWGMSLDELNPDIINRVPIRDDMNELYFPNDEYQCMPTEGYTALFKNLLDHKNIVVLLNKRFDKSMEDEYDHVFNSMPIDVYYGNKFGELPYRSIQFSTVNVPFKQLLPTTTVNFTHDGPMTRVTEWKNIPNHGDNEYMTTLTYETPCDYRDNNGERYYPVKDKDGANQEIYRKYANIKNDKTTFIGRTGLYAYLDMHEAVTLALYVSKRWLKNN